MARIILVEDEGDLREMLRSTLEREGHEVLEAKNGREALRLQRTSRADLVITDILMPETDGVEVLMSLRREAPELKVIAMSGGGKFSQTDALDIAEHLGAAASLRKPFTLREMLEAVSKALAA